MANDKIFAFVGVFFTLIGFIVVWLLAKDSEYAMHYAKQGLVVFLTAIVIMVASMVLAFIPIIGGIVGMVARFALLVLWIIGIVYVFSGEQKYIPVIGKYADKLPL
jgi:uncharacterized membrane protein